MEDRVALIIEEKGGKEALRTMESLLRAVYAFCGCGQDNYQRSIKRQQRAFLRVLLPVFTFLQEWVIIILVLPKRWTVSPLTGTL